MGRSAAVRKASAADDARSHRQEAWRTSCPDWQERIRNGLSLVPQLPLNEEEAERAVRIFDLLRLPDVVGNPSLGTAAGSWFRDAVRALFGSYDPDTGVRHLRELFILVPKKNSKTTYSAALMLVAMFMSRRPRAEFLLVAPTQEVADLAFRQALGMIECDPVLSAKCHVQEHIKRISYRPTGAFLKVKSFDTKVITGSKPAGVLIDETHVIAEMPNADRVIGQVRGGLVSQPEGFLVQITTQSERPPAGVFLSELRKARAVRDGLLEASILPLLYEFPSDVDWRDTSNWSMVLPNAGRSVSIDRLALEFEAAKAAGEDEVRRWASQHLNVEVGVHLVSDTWAGAEFWPRRVRRMTLDDLLERSEVVTIGIDGGGLDDMLGLCVLGRERTTGHWLAWARAWLHPVALERRKANMSFYRDFIADGDLIVVQDSGDNIGQDVRQAAQIVARVSQSGLLDHVGVDQTAIQGLDVAIADEGVSIDRVVAVQQGWRLSGAIKTVERRLADGSFWHAGQRMMLWCVGNARVELRGNNIYVTKQAAGYAKIDPLVALFDAAVLMGANPQIAAQPEVYVL